MSNSTAIAIRDDQVTFDALQKQALVHMGVEHATDADLAIFFHQSKRTGLDPFARQIHMIGRNTKNQRTQQWETKFTIQTGIDGYRLIARRAAGTAGYGYEETLWCGADGQWVDVWTSDESPVACKVVVERGGKRFPAIARYKAYVQTKRDGQPNTIWAQRDAEQLEKCAEALALRKAFPQDLSGIYTEDELRASQERETDPAPAAAQPAGPVTAATFRAAPAEPPAQPGAPAHDPNIEDAAEVPDEPKITPAQQRRLFMLFKAKGVAEHQQRGFLEQGLGRLVTSRTALTDTEYDFVTNHLEGLADMATPAMTPADKAYAELTTDTGKRGLTDRQTREMLEQEFAQPVEDLTAEQLQAALDNLRKTPVPA